MCFYLYGAVNGGSDGTALESICSSSGYSFRAGTLHDVKMCIRNGNGGFRLTDNVCDCEYPLGMNDPSAKELLELEKLILSLGQDGSIEHVFLCKAWEGRIIKKEKTVRSDGNGLAVFLSGADVNCIYKIELQ